MRAKNRRSAPPFNARPAALTTRVLPEPDGFAEPFPGRLVSVRGGNMLVRSAPTTGRAPILLVHGLGGASTNWTDVAWMLREEADVSSVDLFGFGQSGPAPRGRYGLDAHARSVAAYVDGTGRRPVHLVGNSLGGAVCIRLAARRPDLVASLTLISPAMPSLHPRRALDNPSLILGAIPVLGTAGVGRLSAVPPRQRVEDLVRTVYADPSRVPAHRLQQAAEELVATDALPHIPAALSRSLRGLILAYVAGPKHGLWGDLALVDEPVQVIWGQTDRLVSPTLADRTACVPPDGRLLRLPGVGHVAQMEAPVPCAATILGSVELAAARARSEN